MKQRKTRKRAVRNIELQFQPPYTIPAQYEHHIVVNAHLQYHCAQEKIICLNDI